MNVLNASIASVTLIAVILITRMVLLRRLSPKAFMALWGIALCHLLLPLSLPSSLNIWSIIAALRQAFTPEAAVSAINPLPYSCLLPTKKGFRTRKPLLNPFYIQQVLSKH